MAPPLPDFALCVGIDGYPGLTPLSGAEYDARAFHGWATTAGGVNAKKNAELIVSSRYKNGAKAAKAQPASQKIFDFFEKIRKAAKANNEKELGEVAGRRLYMFFSGHGFSPSIDASGVLMANAERDTPHNLSAKAWADRFYENGLFEEVLLFQDACREPVVDVDLTPPYLKRSQMPGIQGRKRFYAFAARSPLLALEKPIGGQVRGIFAATLMEGLGGAAREPRTGEISAEDLKRYLMANMEKRLDQAELDNEDISRRPEVYDPDQFVIVPAAAGAGAAAAAAPAFPVEVALPAGAGARILDHEGKIVRKTAARAKPWRTDLPLGLFELAADNQPRCLFRVIGTIGADGKAELVHVP
jgi:hypothetical protein